MVVANFTYELDTVVIGAGPGGYVAAIRAAQEGKKVAIVERESTLGGVCLNVGCIPSKALISASEKFQVAKDSSVFGINTENVTIDWEKTQEWKDNSVVKRMTDGIDFLMEKNDIEVIKGTAYFNAKNKIHVQNDLESTGYHFKECIIATGSRPIEIKGFKFKNRIIDSTGALNLPEIPESLVVVGGGYIGSELAGVYSRLGTKVTILEGAKEILGGFDKDMVNLVKKQFEAEGTEIVTNALAQKADQTDDGVTVTYEVDGEEKSIDADYVMVTVGRRPNTDDLGLEGIGVELDDRGLVVVDEQGLTSVDKIYAIGDIVPGPALAHKASYEGKIAAEALAGSKSAVVDYKAMPAVAFTHPELASTGHTKASAKEDGYKVKSTKFSYGANGRAVSLDAATGFVKLITDKETGTLLGAQVAGEGASDLIAELTLAVESQLTADDLALTIHAHPTLSEMIMDAAESAQGQGIHG